MTTKQEVVDFDFDFDVNLRLLFFLFVCCFVFVPAPPDPAFYTCNFFVRPVGNNKKELIRTLSLGRKQTKGGKKSVGKKNVKKQKKGK